MDRKTIEEKDRRLVGHIREIVRHNAGTPKGSRPIWRVPIFWTVILCFGVVGVGLTAFRTKPVPVTAKEAPPVPKIRVAETVPPAPKEPARQDEMTAMGIDPQPAEGPTERIDLAAIHDQDSQTPPAVPQKEAPPATTKPEAAAPLIVQSAREPREATEPASKVRIQRIATCTGVDEKQCVSEQTSFSLQEKVKPTVWMAVLSDKQPFSLTHAYYLDGRLYCEVPLEIRYPHMRTWSHITLRNEDQVGAWRVDVMTEDGNRLARVEFVVVP